MKYLFAITGLALLAWGAAIYASYPTTRSEVPVLYWTTGYTEARFTQIDAFKAWLADQGLVTPAGTPILDVRLDAANDDLAKKLIQGVSGVAGDIIDVRGGARLRYFAELGMLTDVTDHARAMGFDPAHTYPTMASEFVVDGRQYGFPCNVFVNLYWVNEDAFRRFNQPPPPTQWTLDEFERRGRAFVAAATPPGQPRRYFFADRVDTRQLFRSMGLSAFNETLTRCTLDDPRFARALALERRWTHELHLLPSAADRAAFATRGGGAGEHARALFAQGHVALYHGNRWASVQLRQLDAGPLDVVHPPHDHFPNAFGGARTATIYRASPHRDLALHFLRFLASEPYNRQIIADGDALPPNPRFTELPEFRQPPEHPNEWGCHERFAHAAHTIAMPGVYSPFVLDAIVQRHLHDARDACLAGLLSPDQAARQAARRVNAEIERTIHDDPDAAARYRRLLQQQDRIDRLRERGEPVPLDLIANPFHRRYYAHMGWSAPAPEPAAP